MLNCTYYGMSFISVNYDPKQFDLYLPYILNNLTMKYNVFNNFTLLNTMVICPFYNGIFACDDIYTGYLQFIITNSVIESNTFIGDPDSQIGFLQANNFTLVF